MMELKTINLQYTDDDRLLPIINKIISEMKEIQN